jgi:hypothetical protein
MKRYNNLSLVALTLLLAACTPKVQVEAPDKPIVIDLNVKIEHHVKVEIDKDLSKVMSDDSLF